jgi:uncharacterized protein (DUF302 family)
MKYQPLKSLLLTIVLLLGIQVSAWAEDIIMVRSGQPFPETMNALQNAILDHGNVVSRVQRVDIGLNTAGYHTDKYRIVFYGKQAELKKITDEHPELIAHLPLKISIFAEGDETLLVALNPEFLSGAYSSPDMEIIYRRWLNDLRSILDEVRKADD